MVSLQNNAQPIFSGEPSVVTYFDALSLIGADIFKEALEYASYMEMSDIRDRASSTPGWSDVADDLSMHIAKRRVRVGATPTKELASKVKELEYGKGSVPPQPILRKHIFNSSSFSERVTEYMDGVL